MSSQFGRQPVTSRLSQLIGSLRGDRTNGQAAAAPGRQADISVAAAQSPAATFDPQSLAALGRLELIAKSVVDGFLSGKHRSTHKGGCTDFAEFRPYARGDSVRLLDWRHYARTDRYYVKRYDDETNLQAMLVVDASGSMNFGLSTVTKWQYAQMAAASLAHLLLRQRDSVGLAVVGQATPDTPVNVRQSLTYVKPQPRASHLAPLLALLGGAEPAGTSALPAALADLSGRIQRRGMVVLLSDCFGDVPALKQALAQYSCRGHDVVIAQILAPEELTFPFRRAALFQDLELPARMQVNPGAVRKAYVRAFQSFMDQLRQAATDLGADLVTFTTSDDLGRVLANFLRRRAAMRNPHRARARG